MSSIPAFEDVPVTTTDDGCWLWTGTVDRNGYPRHGAQWAHRVAHETHIGPIPDRHQVDHLCNVRTCVNPAHLEAVTQVENIRRIYERNGTDARHLAAAELRAQGLTYREIAEVLELAGKGTAGSMVAAAVRKNLIDPDELPEARKLTADEREDIRDLYALGVSQRDLADWYQVDNSNISRAINGRPSRRSAA